MPDFSENEPAPPAVEVVRDSSPEVTANEMLATLQRIAEALQHDAALSLAFETRLMVLAGAPGDDSPEVDVALHSLGRRLCVVMEESITPDIPCITQFCAGVGLPQAAPSVILRRTGHEDLLLDDWFARMTDEGIVDVLGFFKRRSVPQAAHAVLAALVQRGLLVAHEDGKHVWVDGSPEAAARRVAFMPEFHTSFEERVRSQTIAGFFGLVRGEISTQLFTKMRARLGVNGMAEELPLVALFAALTPEDPLKQYLFSYAGFFGVKNSDADIRELREFLREKGVLFKNGGSYRWKGGAPEAAAKEMERIMRRLS